MLREQLAVCAIPQVHTVYLGESIRDRWTPSDQVPLGGCTTIQEEIKLYRDAGVKLVIYYVRRGSHDQLLLLGALSPDSFVVPKRRTQMYMYDLSQEFEPALENFRRSAAALQKPGLPQNTWIAGATPRLHGHLRIGDTTNFDFSWMIALLLELNALSAEHKYLLRIGNVTEKDAALYQMLDRLFLGESYRSERFPQYQEQLELAARIVRSATGGGGDDVEHLISAFTVCTMLCCRDRSLMEVCEGALPLWYGYWFSWQFPMEGDLLEALHKSVFQESAAAADLEASSPPQMILVSEIKSAETREFVMSALPAEYSRANPVYAFKVPFQHVLELVATLQVALEGGYAYITYAHASVWFYERWKALCSAMKLKDQQLLVFPLLERYNQLNSSRWVQRPRTAKYETSDHFKKRSQDFREAHWKPLASGGAIDELEQNFCYFPPSSSHDSVALSHLMMDRTRNFWKNARRSLNSAASLRTRQFSERTSSLLREAVGEPCGNFSVDYLHLLPPCASTPIIKHLEEGTHLRNDQRKLVFRLLEHLGVPLGASQEMWFSMCSGDKSVRVSTTTMEQFCEKDTALGMELTNLYKYQEKARKKPDWRGFASCSTVRKDYKDCCPFTAATAASSSSSSVADIEDLAVSSCQSQCKRSLFADIYGEDASEELTEEQLSTLYWSPVKAAEFSMREFSKLTVEDHQEEDT